jgi:hypothetical protein
MGRASEPPKWVNLQPTRQVDEAFMGSGWPHEINYDGHRMLA